MGNKSVVGMAKNGGRSETVQESPWRHRVKSDEKIHYLVEIDTNVIHDKHCKVLELIPDERLTGKGEYDSSFCQCGQCAVLAYLSIGAKDLWKAKEYCRVYERMHADLDILRKMYVEEGCKTYVNLDTVTVKCRDDTWKIISLDDKGNIRLLHNNYRKLSGRDRQIGTGFHIQQEKTSFSRAFCTIGTYRYERHFEDAPQYKPELSIEPNRKEEQKEIHGIWKFLQGIFKKRKASDEDMVPIQANPYRLRFHLSAKEGFPKRKTQCVYIFRLGDGTEKMQAGIYQPETGKFEVYYDGGPIIIKKNKVVAWLALDEWGKHLDVNDV